MELIEEILQERPAFHSSETEISRGFNPGESFLPHHEAEIVAIRRYAKTKNIDLGNIQFVMKPSDQFLPSANIKNLDMVFLDGKHAFPWPVIDRFYTADRLKSGGIMMKKHGYEIPF